LVEVWLVNGSGNYITDNVSEYDRDINYVYCSDGEFWHDSDAIYCESEGEFISPKDYEADYFLSDWDGEIYNKGVMCTTEDGEVVAEDEILDSNDIWEKTPEGIWIKVKEEE
jgi:hypothetical protein